MKKIKFAIIALFSTVFFSCKSTPSSSSLREDGFEVNQALLAVVQSEKYALLNSEAYDPKDFFEFKQVPKMGTSEETLHDEILAANSPDYLKIFSAEYDKNRSKLSVIDQYFYAERDFYKHRMNILEIDLARSESNNADPKHITYKKEYLEHLSNLKVRANSLLLSKFRGE